MVPTGCAVCRRPFITVARFRSQVSLGGIRGAESVTRTSLSYRCYFGFPILLSFHQRSILKFQSAGTDATWCRQLEVSITKLLMGTGFFPRVKSGLGVTLTPHPLLVHWSGKGRAIPILLLWAVRPVQNLSACTRVHFTFYLISKPLLYLLPY
jgi:hypothetical protein